MERDQNVNDLEFRLATALQFPSLRKPVRREESVAVLAREQSDSVIGGAIVGYFEICMFPPDGRRFEDEDKWSRPTDEPPAPYITNLFVSADRQRQGLGRALLRLAEEIVVKAWGEDKLYLHIDDYEPSRSLYLSSGFQNVSPKASDGITHMWKQLEAEDALEELGSGAGEGAPQVPELERDIGSEFPRDPE